MNKKLLFTGLLVACCGATAFAQFTPTSHNKWDFNTELLLNNRTTVSRSAAANGTASVTIVCEQADDLVSFLASEGFEATKICEDIVTARVPRSFIPTLAAMDNVKHINGPQKRHASMLNARIATGADQVHQGEGLETPFTGKGVIVGVIDQGFQYQHIAFKNKEKQSRVLSVWNHYNHFAPTEKIPDTGDMIKGTGGHATHVTNIAAGSKVAGSNFCGMAPEADIIMIPTTFEDGDILAEAKYIQKCAQKAGKPFVINMSFGSQTGPHDGTTYYCRAMDSISAAGGILVAAMGNEGVDNLHIGHKFTKANEKVYILTQKTEGDDEFYLDLWGQSANPNHQMEVALMARNQQGKLDYKDEEYWKNKGEFYKDIDRNNGKEHYMCYVFADLLRKDEFVLEIKGNPGDEFHVWLESNVGGKLAVPTTNKGNLNFLQSNSDYCVGEGAATIPSAIAVAAYSAGGEKFVSAIDKSEYGYNVFDVGRKGQIAPFSSHGPGLGAIEKKPLVAAPGSVVNSAFNQYDSEFSKNDVEITNIVRDGVKSYYYGVMSGTSMASPAVSGIVALWLEANPQLTYKDVKQIIMETSIHDLYTGKEEWNKRRGYGKIDAYAGLKKALEMAETTGINDQMNSETPVTLQHQGSAIRVLFNNDESFADIVLYNANGSAVRKQHLQDLHRGEETVVTAAGLAPGVYVARITTTGNTVAKKLLVK